MPVQQTFGWCSIRDLTHQCGTPCHWVLIQHGMACCEFDRPGFPHAIKCDRYQKDGSNEALQSA